MNYYDKHIGDYLKATIGLSMAEDGAYTRLLDYYYSEERPLPLDLNECYRIARPQSKAERKAVAFVLNKFFDKKEDGYHQYRADQEIAAFRSKSKKAQDSANKRWGKPQTDSESEGNAKAMRTHSEGNATRAHPIPQYYLEREREARGFGQGQETVSVTSLPITSQTIPTDFLITGDMRAWAAAAVPGVNLDLETQKFCDHAKSTGRVSQDWLAAWRNWIRKAKTSDGTILRGAGNAPRKAAIQNSGYETAAKAWEKVMERAKGRQVALDNRIAESVERIMGGSGALGRSQNLVADRAHFLRMYDDELERDLSRVPDLAAVACV